MKAVNRWILAAALLCPGSALADRGDIFLTLAPAMDIFETGFGGALGLQFGVNPETDFFLEADVTASDIGSDLGMQTQYLAGSFYTPYAGEIRPRLGGSLGVVHRMMDDASTHEVGFHAALHLQALYDASDAMRLFAEVDPYLSTGENGGFGTLVKLGLQFRLSK